jgi:Fe2+ or Zn2+ uptake regulation protein
MIQDSIQVLRAQGYKVTKPRLQVIEILSKAQKPASPYYLSCA